MPKYRVLRIEELGELDFYGNLGAIAEFEDKHGIMFQDIIASGKIGISTAVKLNYECHLIACIRLKKEPVEFETFKAFADMSFLTLATNLIEDVSSEVKQKQKKTTNTQK